MNIELILTPDIKSKIQTKNDLERQRQRARNRHHREILRNEINSLQKEIRHDCNAIRNENWSHMIANLPSNDNKKSLWQVTRLLKNKDKGIPPLKANDTVLLTAQEKANALGAQFASVHMNELAQEDPQFTNSIYESVRQHMNENVSPEHQVSLNETKMTIQQLKTSKSPGFDRMHNSLLKRLPHVGMIYVNFIMNCCFKLCYFPTDWKHAKVIALKKPGKDSRNPANYRPISLLSSLSKVLERILVARINDHLEENNILPDEQGGFRKGRSTVHQLKTITSHVKSNLTIKKSTGIILADIQKAFDSVWHDGLVYKMIQLNFPSYIIRIVNCFLRNRTFQVELNNKLSAVHDVPFGVPQGSCMSPALYNIFTADQPSLENCNRALYADDTALFTSSALRSEITIPLRNAFERQISYFRKWKISININKTQIAFFTKRRTREIPRRPLRISNTSVRWSSDPVKYLGLLLDKRMTLQQHIKYVINKTNIAIRMLYSLLNRKSKMSIENKLMIYKVALRPIFTYAAPVIHGAARTNKKKLQILQNKTLRMCLNKPWHYNTEDLHQEAGIEMVDDFLTRLRDKFEASIA